MIRGIYAAAAGMLASFTRQETIANNLANVNTPGFKRDFTPLREGPELGEVRPIAGLFQVPFPSHPVRSWLGTVGTGALNDPAYTDFANGDVRMTGGELDLALVGPGFFEMQSADGRVHYTRAGEFLRDGAGRLVAANGSFLMGDDGPIRVGQGQVEIHPDGTVLVDGEAVTTLRVLAFPADTPMRKVGDNGFRPVDLEIRPTYVNENTVIQQGAIEGSNVNPTQAVVDMMAAMRSYESAQRLVQMNDQILERAVNDIGRV